MATTREKLNALFVELEAAPLAEAEGKQRDLMELLQIARGFGIDPVTFIVPSSDAEADQMVDGLLVLLLHLRGDDLAPFDLERHIADATAIAGPDDGEA